jgi:hypothetical protein
VSKVAESRKHTFEIGEIDTVRVTVQCDKPTCNGTIVEIPVARIAEVFKRNECPLCKGELDPGSDASALVTFGEMLSRLKASKDRYRVAFVLPCPENQAAE